LQIYDDKSMAAAEYSLARKTCMTEYTVKAYEGVHGEGAHRSSGSSSTRAPCVTRDEAFNLLSQSLSKENGYG